MLGRVFRRLGIGGDAPGSMGPNDTMWRWGPFTRFTIIGADGVPYLTRYYLLKTTRLKVYLHQIHRSDEDRATHCHPWPFISLLLWGPGYEEVRSNGSRHFFPPYSINARLNPADPHRLVLAEGASAQWTLVLVGRKRRDWGFHVPISEIPKGFVTGGRSDYVAGAHFVDHRRFLDLKFSAGETVSPEALV